MDDGTQSLTFTRYFDGRSQRVTKSVIPEWLWTLHELSAVKFSTHE
jgi:hypothetical protein